MDLILRCDWLSEWARWRYLVRSGLPAVSRTKIVLSGTNPGALFHYYESSLFGQDDWILLSFFLRLLIVLDSVSIHKHAKKKTLAKIPPSCIHVWTITHIHLLKPNYRNKVSFLLLANLESM